MWSSWLPMGNDGPPMPSREMTCRGWSSEGSRRMLRTPCSVSPPGAGREARDGERAVRLSEVAEEHEDADVGLATRDVVAATWVDGDPAVIEDGLREVGLRPLEALDEGPEADRVVVVLERDCAIGERRPAFERERRRPRVAAGTQPREAGAERAALGRRPPERTAL